MDGQAVKPSRELKPGDTIEIHFPQYNKIVQVKQLPKNRVSAKQLPDILIDLTPAAEYERLQLMRQFNYEKRDRGIGRPTKKERRVIDKLKSGPKNI